MSRPVVELSRQNAASLNPLTQSIPELPHARFWGLACGSAIRRDRGWLGCGAGLLPSRINAVRHGFLKDDVLEFGNVVRWKAVLDLLSQFVDVDELTVIAR